MAWPFGIVSFGLLSSRYVVFSLSLVACGARTPLPGGELTGPSTPSGTSPDPSSDLPVPTQGIRAIAAGNAHTCALTVHGGVKCWGDNSNGELGPGAIGLDSSRTPIDVEGATSDATAVAAGSTFTCAVVGGGVLCWGTMSSTSLEGQGSSVWVVDRGSGIVGVAAGEAHACMLRSSGDVQCWGKNLSGELGDGTTSNSATPVPLSDTVQGYAVVSAGGASTCGARRDGTIMCWGDLERGGSHLTSVPWPIAVAPSSSVAAGAYHACARTRSATVACWGGNSSAQLGVASADGVVDVPDVAGIASIAGGGLHTCALAAGGDITCWGRNTSGQIGDGATAPTAPPSRVRGARGRVVAIAAGFEHSCAIALDGTAQCWGANAHGQLGDGTTTSSSAPVDVQGL